MTFARVSMGRYDTIYEWIDYVGSRRILYCKLDLPAKFQHLILTIGLRFLQIGIDFLKCP